MRINSCDRCTDTAIRWCHYVQITSDNTHKERINQLILCVEHASAWGEYVGRIDYDTIAVVQWGGWCLNGHYRWKCTGYRQIAAHYEWPSFIDAIIRQFDFGVLWRGCCPKGEYNIINILWFVRWGKKLVCIALTCQGNSRKYYSRPQHLEKFASFSIEYAK